MEDYIPVELVKKLEKKGFNISNISAITIYDGDSQLLSLSKHGLNIGECDVAISISQVLKWLRKEKCLYVSPSLFHIGYRPYIQSTLFENDKTYTNSWFLKSYYSSYEEAAIAGIEFVIDKLI